MVTDLRGSAFRLIADGYLSGQMAKLAHRFNYICVRSSQQGESHGGVYLVDLHTGHFDQVIDWNDRSISWEGRGGDRGLRGIAFHQGKVYIAASDEVFVYNRQFELLESYRNKYLKHCHEIFIAGDIFISHRPSLTACLNSTWGGAFRSRPCCSLSKPQRASCV